MRSELVICPHGPLHVHRRFCSVTPTVTPTVTPAMRPDRFAAREVNMPRGPKGKRVVAGDGYSVAAKNSNGVGSVYFEPPSTRADGTVVKGRWRATYVDLDGTIKRVSGPTRALAESRPRRTRQRTRPAPLADHLQVLDHDDRPGAERLVARVGCSSPGARVVARDVPEVGRILRRGTRPRARHRRRTRDGHGVAVRAARSTGSVHRPEQPQGLSSGLRRGRQDGTDRHQPIRPGPRCRVRKVSRKVVR